MSERKGRMARRALAVLVFVPVLLAAKPAWALTPPVLSGTVLSDTSIRLNWTDAGNEQQYLVFRNGGQITTLSSSVHTFTDTGLSPGTTYSYRVDAKKGQTVVQSNTIQLTTTSPPPPTPGKIVVMLVNFSGDNRQPWTAAFIDSLYDGAPPSVADFYAQSSWGAWTVSSDVFGWFSTSAPSTGCNLTQIAQDGNAAATASGVNLNLYSNRVYLFPANPNCTFGGTADFNGNRVWINLSPDSCTVANDCDQDFHTLVHEYGHNLGLNHATSYICTNGSGGHVVLSTLCTQNEYGDQFDVMGCCQASLFSNVHRLQLGWIPQSQVVTVTTSQTLTVTSAYVSSSPIYRIPDGTGSYLYLENRAITTIYDVGGGSPWANGNLLIRRAPDVVNGAFTQLLDGSPADNDTIPNAKSLPIGASFTTPGGITISNLGYDGANNSVGVTIG